MMHAYLSLQVSYPCNICFNSLHSLSNLLGSIPKSSVQTIPNSLHILSVMLSMGVLCALLTDLLVAAEAVSLHHAGLETAPCFIFRVCAAMKGQAQRNNGYSQSRDDVRGVAEDMRSSGLSPFLLFKHTQHIFYLKINTERIRQKFNTFD